MLQPNIHVGSLSRALMRFSPSENMSLGPSCTGQCNAPVSPPLRLAFIWLVCTWM